MKESAGVRDALSAGTVVANRYEVVARLGLRGMGTVYKAHDRELDELVALKVLRLDVSPSPEAVQRFRTEVKLARRVSHPHVCRLFEYGVAEPLRYACMELVEGVSLREELTRGRRLPAERAVESALAVAAGLQAIHAAGLVHGGLKASNVQRETGSGRIVLLDLGIAEAAADAPSAARLAGAAVGTPHYMAPELAGGERADSRSDLYALGVLLFELLDGEVPFRSGDPRTDLAMHQKEPPPLDRLQKAGAPRDLVDLVARLLAKRPEDRPSSAREVEQALSRVAAGLRGPRAAAPVAADDGLTEVMSALEQEEEAALSGRTLVSEAAPSSSATRASRPPPTARPRRYTMIVGGSGEAGEEALRRLRACGLEVEHGSEDVLRDETDRIAPALVVLETDGAAGERHAALARLRALPILASVPVLVLGRETDIDSFTGAITGGGAAYLVKPVAEGVLETTARRLSGWNDDPAMREKRRHVRRPVLLAADVELRTSHRAVVGDIVEVSSAGCQLDLPEAVAQGDKLRITPRAAVGSTHMALGGEVRWHRAVANGRHMAGVQFTGRTAVFAPSVFGVAG